MQLKCRLLFGLQMILSTLLLVGSVGFQSWILIIIEGSMTTTLSPRTKNNHQPSVIHQLYPHMYDAQHHFKSLQMTVTWC